MPVAGTIERTPVPGLQASGTPLHVLGTPRKKHGTDDRGDGAAADAIRKLRQASGGTGEEQGEDDGQQPRGRRRPQPKPNQGQRRESRSTPARNDSDDSGDDQGEEGDDGQEEGDDQAPARNPRRSQPTQRKAPARTPRAADDGEDRTTQVDGDYSRSADDEDQDQGEDDQQGGDEGDEGALEDPLAQLAEHYRVELTGGDDAGQGRGGQPNHANGQANGQPGYQQPPAPGPQGRPQGGQQGQQHAGQSSDSIFSTEEIQSLREDGNEVTAKVMEAANTRLGTRLQQVEQLLVELASTTMEGLSRRQVRTVTEDRKFFEKAAAEGYGRVLGVVRKGEQVPAPIARNRKAVAKLADRIQRDQMSGQDPSFLSRDEALDVAVRALFPKVERNAAEARGRKSVEDRIVRRHRGLSLTPSGGQRTATQGGRNSRETEMDEATAAIGAWRQKRGVA